MHDPLRPGLNHSARQHAPWFMFRDQVEFGYSRLHLPIAELAPQLEGLRVLHLSDLHARGSWLHAYDRLIEILDASPPDLLLFTGDFVDDKLDCRAAVPILKRLLPRLRSRLGTYAILGNHDGDLLQPFLRDLGVHLIDGGRALLDWGGAAIELIGLPGIARRDLDCGFVAAQPPRRPGVLRIVLSHYPDHIRRAGALGADVLLAGHTHGGQICLPGGKAMFTHDSLPRHMSQGLHRVGDTWMLVSRGFGFTGVPLRLFCPAEIAELTLQRSAP